MAHDAGLDDQIRRRLRQQMDFAGRRRHGRAEGRIAASTPVDPAADAAAGAMAAASAWR